MSVGYRPDIDGLRAIAVLVVLFFHAGINGFEGGYVERNDQNAINCNLLNQRISNYIIENEIKAVVLVARWAFYGKGDYDGEEKQYISDLPILNAERLPSQGSFERLFNQTVDFYTKMVWKLF